MYTKGELSFIDDGTLRIKAWGESDQMADYRGNIICDVTQGLGHKLDEAGREHARQETLANAHRIVHTWNCHPELVEALEDVHKLICEGAKTGFNCEEGDWAEKLFHSNQKTSVALAKAKSTDN